VNDVVLSSSEVKLPDDSDESLSMVEKKLPDPDVLPDPLY